MRMLKIIPRFRKFKIFSNITDKVHWGTEYNNTIFLIVANMSLNFWLQTMLFNHKRKHNSKYIKFVQNFDSF